MASITVDELLARYDVFLLDAYGVLVKSSGPLPGAAAFLRRLTDAKKPWLILSNDASRSLQTTARRYAGFGLSIPVDAILTSGLLLGDHFAAQGLAGARCIVLGTEDSNEYVRAAGGVVVPADDDSADVLVVADDDGYPFLETVNSAISVLLRRLAAGRNTHLVLPNPDLVFPMGDDNFGVTSGAVAAMIEAVLSLRQPQNDERSGQRSVQRCVPLGKPHRPMYEAAARRFPDVDRRRMVMLGDQLGTDILGAVSFGIDSVLVLTGVARLADLETSDVKPTFTLSGLV